MQSKCTFSSLICTNDLGKSCPAGEAVIISGIGANQEGNVHIQINDLSKSIATCTRLLYVCPKSDVFSTLVKKWEILTSWVSDLCTRGMEND